MSGRARLPNVEERGCGDYEWRIPLLILVSLCLFANTAFGGFVFDDHEAIENNPDVRLDTPLSVLFNNDFWGTPLLDPESHKSYRPLTTLTFKWNHQLHGMQPLGYHLVNILLHSLVCVLLYCVFVQVGVDRDTSVMAALLFAVHPIHTEAVANIVGRAEILSSIFYLLSISSFLRFHSRSNSTHIIWWRPYLWVFLTLALALAAMLSKEQGLTCLGVCLIYDLFIVCRLRLSAFSTIKWPGCDRGGGGTTLSDIASRLSLWILLVSSLGLLAFRFTIIQGQTPVFTGSDNPASHSSSLKTRFLTYSYLCFFNFWLLLYPSRLCFDWSMGSVPLVDSINDWRNMCTVCLFTIVLIFTAVGFCDINHCTVEKVKRSGASCVTSDQEPNGSSQRCQSLPRQAALLFALSMMIVPFLPASNLFFPVGFVVAERILYMPSMGFCLLVVIGMRALQLKTIMPGMHGKNSALATTTAMRRVMLPLVLLLLLLLMSLKTVLRNAEWSDDETLALSGLKTNPLNAKIYTTLGNSLAQKGDRRCEGYYREALRLKPDYTMAWANLGLVLLNTDRPNEAEKCYMKALSIQPNHINANTNMGHLCRLQGRWYEALKHFSTANDRHPNNPILLYYSGLMLFEIGDSELAEEKFDAALKLNPGYSEVYFALGKLLSSDTTRPPAVHQRAKVSNTCGRTTINYTNPNYTVLGWRKTKATGLLEYFCDHPTLWNALAGDPCVKKLEEDNKSVYF